VLQQDADRRLKAGHVGAQQLCYVPATQCLQCFASGHTTDLYDQQQFDFLSCGNVKRLGTAWELSTLNIPVVVGCAGSAQGHVCG
jgi:hypothetical protein